MKGAVFLDRDGVINVNRPDYVRSWQEFVFLPGVPSEMQAMFTQTVEPLLVECFQLRPARTIVLYTFGLGESALQQRLASLALPREVRLGFRAGVQQNEVKLSFPYDFPVPASEALVSEVVELLGDAVFTVSNAPGAEVSLATVVGGLLEARGATLATAETFSAGQLAWSCRGQSCLLYSAVAPDRRRLLRGLGSGGLEARSYASAGGAHVAEALRRESAADYALAILGPPPESEEDHWPPPVAVTIALAGPARSAARELSLTGPAERCQIQAAATALDDLRRELVSEASRA